MKASQICRMLLGESSQFFRPKLRRSGMYQEVASMSWLFRTLGEGN